MLIKRGIKSTLLNVANEFKDCHYCSSDTTHLIVLVSATGHVHVHAPFDDDVVMKKLLDTIEKEWTLHKNARLSDAKT